MPSKSKRQTFKQGEIVFLNTSRGSQYSLPSWGKGMVVQYPAEECLRARGFGYHRCDPKNKEAFSACNRQTDLSRVKIHRLDRDGKRQEGAWARATINNTRAKILTLEEGQPIMVDLAKRVAERDQEFKKRGAKNTAIYRMQKAMVPMAKALKRVTLILDDGTIPLTQRRGEAMHVLNNALDLLKAPKEEED